MATKTGTYKASTSKVATPGTSSAANKALQTSLNAKGANIAVDGKYGPQTAAAVAKYGGGGGSTTTTTTNPVKDSTQTRATLTAERADIRALEKAYKAEQAMWQQQQAALAERRANEVAGIKSEFDIASKAQEGQQAGDYASRATTLVTSGGGFLGATQSQQGVLENLKKTFDAEKTALLAKRESAINAANAAYEDKDFALAREMSNSAKDYQKTLYQREKDFADQTLAIAKENRAQTEFDYGLTDKKITAYSKMSDEDFAKVDTSETDAMYYPGYTSAQRKAEKLAASAKSQEDAIDLQSKILTMTNKIAAGKKFTVNGVTYVGTKSNAGDNINDPIPTSIANQLGIPNIAGMSQSDIILSLDLANPPSWYMQLYKAQNPAGWEIVKNNPAAIKADWINFKSNPEFEPFKNTVKIDKVSSKNDVSSLLGPINVSALMDESEL